MALEALYIIPKKTGSGSLLVALGLMEILKRHYRRVACFKPVAQMDDCDKKDTDIETMISAFRMEQSYEEAVGCSVGEAEKYLTAGDEVLFYEEMISRYEHLSREYDFVLCLGVRDIVLDDMLGFDLNIALAKNFSTPVVGVFSAYDHPLEIVNEDMIMWKKMLKKENLKPFAFFINHLPGRAVCQIESKISLFSDTYCFAIPYEPKLDKPVLLDYLGSIKAKILFNVEKEMLERPINKAVVAAMMPEQFLSSLDQDDLVIVPSDRTDILMSVLAIQRVHGFAKITALVINGKKEIASVVRRLMEVDETFHVPVLRVEEDTMPVASALGGVKVQITSMHKRKIVLAIGHFLKYVQGDLIEDAIKKSHIDLLTPTMFLHRVFAKAVAYKKRIVLPESEDDRILRAVETIIHRGIAEIVLLGDEQKVRNRAGMLGVDIEDAKIVNHIESEKKDRFAQLFYELRKSKGVNLEMAKDLMQNPTYFATMMVYTGMADGMVSGATHTTRETVLPALQIIKTKPGVDIVSSLFFMCLETRVLVYGDCAIVPDPTPEELAQIAIESAQTAKTFGIEPIVAMLSYSTGDSGVGEDVEKVRKATKLAQKMRPDILIEGPMQYDAAVDPQVAKRKMPGSRVAGRATVFIFPDLNTGNTTYKAVQRSTGAIAIGPVLQGLKKAVNDLSRGCSVDDIVSTVAITAVQAHQLEEESK